MSSSRLPLRIALKLPEEAIWLLYGVLGHFPHDPGSWSHDARSACSAALNEASNVRQDRKALGA